MLHRNSCGSSIAGQRLSQRGTGRGLQAEADDPLSQGAPGAE